MGADVVPQDGNLPELVYQQLKAIAHARMLGERSGHLLHTTALVHEALLKLTQDGRINLEDRPGFFRAAAASMRQILIDHARAAGRQKRGGGRQNRIELRDNAVATAQTDPDLILTLEEAICRLEETSAEAAAVVHLRFFGGLNVEEAATTLGVSPRSVDRLWNYARAWLWRELSSTMTGAVGADGAIEGGAGADRDDHSPG